MTTINQYLVYVVDDNKDISQVIKTMLMANLGICCSSFTHGHQCLDNLKSKMCDLLVTNTSTVGMDGIDLLRKVKRAIPPLPVIVISNVPDVRIAVEAMKLGAFDFLAKPFDGEELTKTVQTALSLSIANASVSGMQLLTPVEQSILKLILQSKSTKEIARIRSRSARTIEDQRQSIMQKLGASDLVDLAKRTGLVNFHQYLSE